MRYMDAYEFYWRDPIKGYQFIGGLPERRKNLARITQESVIDLARELIGDNVNVDDIFIVKITKDEKTGKIVRPDPVYRPLKEYFKDRRQYPRMYMDLPLEYRVGYAPQARGGIVIDASETGFLIYSRDGIPVGTKMKVAVLFPKEYELAMFEVLAEIIRKKFVAKEEEEGYQYGLKFVQILEEDHRKLRELLKGSSQIQPVE
jgi:c-di-GMP-binding flagellar brake protein YcgR